MTLAPALTRQARCATPEGRVLVDAAFAHPGSPEAKRLERELCSGCPIWRECLDDAMTTGEHGPWGGTSRKRRTHAGAPVSVVANLTNVVHPGAGSNQPTVTTGGRQPSRRAVLLRRLRLNGRDVQLWAVEQGLQPSVIRGLPRLDVVEAYAEAHHLTAA